MRFRDQSGRPLADMADVGALDRQIQSAAEAEFQDAKFRLLRAIAAGDAAALRDEAARSRASFPTRGIPIASSSTPIGARCPSRKRGIGQ